MIDKLRAILDNRTFYFTLTERKPDEVIIDMYNTKYILVNKDGTWLNHLSNRMSMSKELVGAVLAAIPAD